MKDLRTFFHEWEKKVPTDVLRIEDEVDPRFDISAYTLELERVRKYPILFFNKVKGFDMPVLSNLLATKERVAAGLGTTKESFNTTWLQREKNLTKPRLVNEGPVKEIILKGEELDLRRLPIPTHFSQDGGPYITAGNFVAKDPDTGFTNVSLHRLQLKDKDKLGASLHSRRHLWDMQRRAEEQGKPLELAIVIGVHPTFTFGSVWRGLLDVDEYEVIGGLAEEPLEVVKCETIEVEVPANAEIVIEGEILPKVREPEGPLGEYTGYASHRSTKNVMKVKAITHRKDAIYHNIVPGFSAEHEIVSETGATPAVYRSVKESVPTVKNVNFSMSAPSVYYCYISIKKTVEGQPKQAIFAALGSDRAVKLVVVVDDDINVYNEKEVIWAVSTRLRADEGLFVVPGVMDSLLDPSSKDGVSAKIGIDATKPLEGWIAEKCTVPEDVLAKIRSRLSL